MNRLPQRPVGVLKEARGFTLVELIVTLAIAVVCMSLIMTILIAGTTMTATQLDKEANKNLGDNVMEFLKEAIQYSTEGEVNIDSANPPASPSSVYGTIYVSADGGTTLAPKGSLYFKRASSGSTSPTQDVFGSDFYNTRKIGLSVEVIDVDTLVATVQVYDSTGDKLLYKTSKSITLVASGFNPTIPGINPSSGNFSPARISFK